MALNVAQSGGRPNFLPGVIKAGVKRANTVTLKFPDIKGLHEIILLQSLLWDKG